MTERTASGRTRRSRTPRASKKKREESLLNHLGPMSWAFAMLMTSVALAAAAVFTHRS
jgi:hypothetical protein